MRRPITDEFKKWLDMVEDEVPLLLKKEEQRHSRVVLDEFRRWYELSYGKDAEIEQVNTPSTTRLPVHEISLVVRVCDENEHCVVLDLLMNLFRELSEDRRDVSLNSVDLVDDDRETLIEIVPDTERVRQGVVTNETFDKIRAGLEAKIRAGLEAAGVTGQQIVNCVIQMQNKGVVFGEESGV